jgi:D-arabinose 1-dehydrogenase-like Zn-dependent alcohol dehydrogenase
VGVHTDGGYAPRAVLPALNAVSIGDVDPVAATVAPDAVATPLHVCGDRARLGPGDRVVVIGAGGGVGAHMIQVAALFGGDVTGFDVGDDKLGLVEELGATPVDSRNFGAIDPSSLWRSGPPTVVIDLVGSRESLEWSSAALASGGRLAVLTTFRDREFPVDPRQLVFKEATVTGCRYASRAEVRTAAELVASGRVRPVVGARVGPEDVLKLHDRLGAGQLRGRGALVWS